MGVPGRRRTFRRPTSSTRTLSTHALPVRALGAPIEIFTLSYHRLLKPQRTSRHSVVPGTRAFHGVRLRLSSVRTSRRNAPELKGRVAGKPSVLAGKEKREKREGRTATTGAHNPSKARTPYGTRT